MKYSVTVLHLFYICLTGLMLAPFYWLLDRITGRRGYFGE